MSGRFVRVSKYRHVHGEPNRKDKCYTGIRAAYTGEANFVKANTKFLAFASTGGGGPLVIHRLEDLVRLDHTPPTLNVHKAPLMDWDFSPFMENLVATGSEDGYVKVTVFPENGLSGNIEEASATFEGHQKKISWVHWHPTASNVLASGSFDNTIRVWDAEKGVQKYCQEFAELPQSFEWNRDGSLIGCTVKDKTVKIFDPRAPNGIISGTSLPGAKGARFSWLDSEKVVVLGFSATSSRQFAIYDARKLGDAMEVIDIDQSAGILMPYFDPDTNVLFVAGKGDATIRYFEYTNEGPFLHFLSEFRSNEAQKGVGWLTKRACDTKICEIARAFRLCKDYIEPVSFQVPRKSDLFQEDIFPDTFAGIPALTADEYFEGKNKEAAKVSMKPGAAHSGEGAKAVFKASKSPAQYEHEIADLTAKLEQALKTIDDLKRQLGKH